MPRIREDLREEVFRRSETNLMNQEVVADNCNSRCDYCAEGYSNRREYNQDDMVECRFNGAVFKIPKKLFLSILLRSQVNEKKYIRYKEGAKIYSMSEREFNRLAHDAGAVYKGNKMALVKLEIIDKYLEYFKE